MNAVGLIKKHFDKLSGSKFKCKAGTKQEDDGKEVEKNVYVQYNRGRKGISMEP